MDDLEDRTQNKSQPGVVTEDPPLPALFFTFCASEEGDGSRNPGNCIHCQSLKSTQVSTVNPFNPHDKGFQ